jgi:plasmid stability protein
MATLTIRRLDDAVYEKLRERAQANGRSLEAEARHILSERAKGADDVVERLRAFRQEMFEKHGIFPDSTPLIRAMRDEE